MHTQVAATGNTIRREHEHVLRLLRDAGERPLSFEALHDAGVAHPATVLYELELRGFAISRVVRRRGGSRDDEGFRLDGSGAAPDPH